MAADLNILLVGDFPPPSGGVATHVEDLFRAVRARGGRCEVLDIGKGQLPADGVTPAGGMPRFAALLASYASRGFRIHLHTGGANPKSWLLASACAAAGLASGRPALVTLHSGVAAAWLSASPRRAAMARAVLRRFGAVIAVSEELRAALGLPGIEVLPAFTREFLQPSHPPAGFAELRAEASPLFCAMLPPNPEYGGKTLLSAFRRVRATLPSARLALYGAGTEAFGPEPGARSPEPVVARRPEPAIHGFGELSRPEVLAVLAASDVFVRPTLADGDSISVREALALGRAVVATRVGNRPSGIRLVAPGDEAALAEAMLEAAREISARPVRTVSAPAPDPLQRILTLYGWTPPAPAPATRAPEEAAPCAASAAS